MIPPPKSQTGRSGRFSRPSQWGMAVTADATFRSHDVGPLRARLRNGQNLNRVRKGQACEGKPSVQVGTSEIII